MQWAPSRSSRQKLLRACQAACSEQQGAVVRSCNGAAPVRFWVPGACLFCLDPPVLFCRTALLGMHHLPEVALYVSPLGTRTAGQLGQSGFGPLLYEVPIYQGATMVRNDLTCACEIFTPMNVMQCCNCTESIV